MIAEYNGANSLTHRWVPGPGTDETLVWYKVVSGVTSRFWLTQDERASVIATTDDTGAVTGKNTYDAYGKPAASNIGRFQYTGQMWFSGLQLSYYKARWYSSTYQRFLETDPIGEAGGVNLYAYAGGDPVNNTDPSGHGSDYGRDIGATKIDPNICTPSDGPNICTPSDGPSCTEVYPSLLDRINNAEALKQQLIDNFLKDLPPFKPELPRQRDEDENSIFPTRKELCGAGQRAVNAGNNYIDTGFKGAVLSSSAAETPVGIALTASSAFVTAYGVALKVEGGILMLLTQRNIVPLAEVGLAKGGEGMVAGKGPVAEGAYGTAAEQAAGGSATTATCH